MADMMETGAVTGEAAWHRKSVVIPNGDPATRNVRQYMAIGGMDWSVLERPLYTTVPEVDPSQDDRVVEASEHKALVRDFDGKVLSIMSEDYGIGRHGEIFDLLQPLLDNEVLSELVSIGSLRGGKTFYLQARYGEPAEVAPGDAIEPFLTLAGSYDGTLSQRIMDGKIRVVCMNTLRAAGAWKYLVTDGDTKTEDGWSIPHRGDVMAKVAAAIEEIEMLREQFGLSIRFFRRLSTMPMGEPRVREVAELLFGDEQEKLRRHLAKLRLAQEHAPQQMRPETEALIAQIEAELAKPNQAVEHVVAGFHQGPGHQMAGETAWGALNAITHYIDHGKRGSADSRMHSAWFGEGAHQRKKAMALFGEMAGAL